MALTQHEATAAKPERKSILSWHWVLVLKILCALSAALVFKLQILRFNRPCRGNHSHTMRYSHPCKPRSHIAFAKSQGAESKGLGDLASTVKTQRFRPKVWSFGQAWYLVLAIASL